MADDIMEKLNAHFAAAAAQLAALLPKELRGYPIEVTSPPGTCDLCVRLKGASEDVSALREVRALIEEVIPPVLATWTSTATYRLQAVNKGDDLACYLLIDPW